MRVKFDVALRAAAYSYAFVHVKRKYTAGKFAVSAYQINLRRCGLIVIHVPAFNCGSAPLIVCVRKCVHVFNKNVISYNIAYSGNKSAQKHPYKHRCSVFVDCYFVAFCVCRLTVSYFIEPVERINSARQQAE